MSSPQPETFTIPLFPLHAVLFPRFPIPLHIFEERYRVMIDTCIERDEPFGIALIREGREVGGPATPYEVGCLARIVAVKRFEDGRMDLVALGLGRFRLLDHVDAHTPYLVGRVEALDDDLGPPEGGAEYLEIRELTNRLSERFDHYLSRIAKHAGMPRPDLDFPNDPVDLAFCVGSIAQFDMADKQRLLEMTDARARIVAALAMLDGLIDAIAGAERSSRERESEVELASPRPVDLDSDRWANYRRLGNN